MGTSSSSNSSPVSPKAPKQLYNAQTLYCLNSCHNITRYGFADVNTARSKITIDLKLATITQENKLIFELVVNELTIDGPVLKYDERVLPSSESHTVVYVDGKIKYIDNIYDFRNCNTTYSQYKYFKLDNKIFKKIVNGRTKIRVHKSLFDNQNIEELHKIFKENYYGKINHNEQKYMNVIINDQATQDNILQVFKTESAVITISPRVSISDDEYFLSFFVTKLHNEIKHPTVVVPICEVSSVERLSKETDEDNNSSNVNDSRNINELNNDIVYPLVAEPICVGTVVEQVT